MVKKLRAGWENANRELSLVEQLSDDQRVALARILLRRAVERRAQLWSPWGITGSAITIIVLSIAFLGVPITASLMAKDYAVHGWSVHVTFWVIYLLVLTFVSWAFTDEEWEEPRLPLFIVIVLGYGLLLLFVNGIGRPSQRDVTIAVLAATGIAVLVALGFRAAVSLLDRTLGRAATRSAMAMVPAQALAALLTDLLLLLASHRSAWRHHTRLRAVTSWTGELIHLLERQPELQLNAARLGRTARAEIAQRGRQAAQAIRAYESRLLAMGRVEDYDQLLKDVATAAARAAAGEWIAGSGESPPRRARIVAIAKRVVAAATLAGAALVLPRLPGVDAEQTAITGIQVGLFLSAALTLIPATSEHIDRIVSAVKEASGSNP